MEDGIMAMINDSIEAKVYLAQQADILSKAAETIYACFNQGNKLLVFGNGGSAADAQHISAELMGKFKKERQGLAAIALTTDTSFMTAFGNDYEEGFKNIFARQVETLAKRGDILWGISTSGIYENVLRAFKKGHEIGTYNLSLSGRDGGELRKLSDLNITISS